MTISDEILNGIFLPLLLDLTNRCLTQLSESNAVLKGLYIRATKTVVDRIQADMDATRKRLMDENILIIEESRTEDECYYMVSYKDKNDTFIITKSIAKYELGVRLRRYMDELGRELSAVSERRVLNGV
jgi:hypothetical protein